MRLKEPDMKTVKVIAAGFSAAGMDMGDLVDKGILTKKYHCTYYGNTDMGADIVWTNVSKDTIVDNGLEVIYPGESVTWEK
jgi:hypothetical protein